MNFHEWMTVSEAMIGKEGMAVFEQCVRGNISVKDCLKQMCEVMSQENMAALKLFIDNANK